MHLAMPEGFSAYAANLGVKDGSPDFALVTSAVPCNSAIMLTRSLFAGPSVLLARQSREASAKTRAVSVISGNANVANGPVGLENATEVRQSLAGLLGAEDAEILTASTGVIGRPYPMDAIRKGLGQRLFDQPANLLGVAEAMMTTDTVPKAVSVRIGDATLSAVAKGVGMVEPDMATMLAFFFTDAQISREQLGSAFSTAVEASFNSLTIDGDTSTSDTAAILANGLAGPVKYAEFAEALRWSAVELARAIARDGEGATKLIAVTVTGASDDAQARRVAKTIARSPLVKTAVHGADPNWGRVAMAIGKCWEETSIEPGRVRIGFGDLTLYPQASDPGILQAAASHLQSPEVKIWADLGIAQGQSTVYGCDLGEGYVRINADYTT